MYTITRDVSWVCVLEIALYGEFSVSNATGSFQNHCSVASQMNPFADEPSSSGTGAKRPIRRRDMTALLAEVALPSPMNSRSERGSKIKALAALVHNPKRIRVSAVANDHDNHTIDKEVVDVNHSTAALAIGTAGTAVVSQVRVLYIL